MQGLVAFVLIFICTCAYIRAVPRLKSFFLSERKGVWGALYKASVVGTRLHWLVSASCLCSAGYLLYLTGQ